MYGEGDYVRLWVKFYEDMVKFFEIIIFYCYFICVNGYYVIDFFFIFCFDVFKFY